MLGYLFSEKFEKYFLFKMEKGGKGMIETSLQCGLFW